MEAPLSERHETVDIPSLYNLAKKPLIIKVIYGQIQAGYLAAPALIYYQQP